MLLFLYPFPAVPFLIPLSESLLCSVRSTFPVACTDFLLVIYDQPSGLCQTYIIWICCVFHVAFIAFISVQCVTVWHVYFERKPVFDDSPTSLFNALIDPFIIDIKNVTIPQSNFSLWCLLFHPFQSLPF